MVPDRSHGSARVHPYPAPPEETNLRAIPVMRERFGVEVGYSDHTMGIGVPVAAVTLGPLAGILTAGAGAVVLLTALADGVAEATGDLASTLDR